MKPGKNSQPTEEISEEIQDKNTLSIDEFFKQLEAKEKDLDISAEMVIEIEGEDFDENTIPHFIVAESLVDDRKVNETDVFASNAASENTLSSLKNKVSLLQKQISKLETERLELFEISRRRQIDFEGYKKRTERERSETFLNQISNLAMQVLPVLDNFNRALESASTSTGEKVSDSQHFFNGIVLVNQQLNEVLTDMGVSQIISVGKPFDPHFHEAVATEETDEIPPHTITAELLRGYRIGDKVIRPSMVKVSTQVTNDK
jgi:molecular chaperone GrpE